MTIQNVANAIDMANEMGWNRNASSNTCFHVNISLQVEEYIYLCTSVSDQNLRAITYPNLESGSEYCEIVYDAAASPHCFAIDPASRRPNNE